MRVASCSGSSRRAPPTSPSMSCDRVRRLLADAVKAARAANPHERYREVLSAVLDYRSWRTFELSLDDGTTKERLTRQRYGKLSGGEKSVALHLPLLAAAHATFAGASPTCPRLLALDEAFEGIDETGRDELLALTVAFDLDLFLTGYRLWVTSKRVPAVAHYELRARPERARRRRAAHRVERTRAGRRRGDRLTR